MPNLQRSPPDQSNLALETNIPNTSDHYNSDSALHIEKRCDTDFYFNHAKKPKRSMEDLEDTTDPTLSLIMSLFADFKKQQDEKFDNINQTLNTIMSQNQDIRDTVEKLSTRQDELLTKVTSLESENSMMKQRISVLENRLEEQEKNACSTSLEVRNLPKQETENKSTLINIMQTLGTTLGLQTPLKTSEIKNIFRTKNNNVIVADFTTALRRDEYISKFKSYNKHQRESKLPVLDSSSVGASDKDTPRPIYVAESLTKKGRRLYFLAREQVRNKSLYASWTSFGRIFVKESEGSTPTLIVSERDLQNPPV